MKSFIAAICVFVSTLIFVGIYSYSANSFFDKMFSILDDIESDNFLIYELHDMWLKKKDFLELSLTHGDIDHFVMSIIDMKSYYESHDVPNFHKSLNEAREALEHISEHEDFSLNTLL